MSTAIFLGGGASAAEGTPMQTDLFREYFKLVRADPGLSDTVMYREITTYFREVFGIDCAGCNPEELIFPTFEEALGILDLAVRRREALKHFDLENISHNSNRIGFMRQYLVLLMASVLDYKSEKITGTHKLLINSLESAGMLQNTIFITTNYDILIDNAIYTLEGHIPDYSIDFTGEHHLTQQDQQVVKLYKVHGSLNWLYCPACNSIRLTSREKGVMRLLNNRDDSDCDRCRSILLPVIIPPTFYKDMSNVFLSIVWNKAEQALRQADRIIFCGYSFPDSDMHVKYLMKRVQTNRQKGEDFKMFVVNNHPGKNPHLAEKEKNRFQRFLGPAVRYTDLSFEVFAANPSHLYS